MKEAVRRTLCRRTQNHQGSPSPSSSAGGCRAAKTGGWTGLTPGSLQDERSGQQESKGTEDLTSKDLRG